MAVTALPSAIPSSSTVSSVTEVTRMIPDHPSALCDAMRAEGHCVRHRPVPFRGLALRDHGAWKCW